MNERKGERNMLEIYLTRHGETMWNQVRRMQGHEDSPLTELGLNQGKWLGERLKGKDIPYIYSSPLGRAKETTKILNDFLNSKMIIDERLKEICVGPWQGMLVEEIERESPKAYDDFWHHPERFDYEGVESFEAVKERAGDFIEDLLKNHGSGKILVVAHAIVLTAMLNYIEGRDVKGFWEGKHILPTSLTKLNAIGDRISVVYMSDTSHYEEAMEKGWFIDK